MVRDRNKTFEQHEQDDIQLEAAWRSPSGYAAIPRNMTFNPLWQEAYNDAIAMYGDTWATRPNVHEHIKAYLENQVWSRFNHYVRTIHGIPWDDVNWTYTRKVRSYSAPGSVLSEVDVGESSDTGTHRRVASQPAPTTSSIDSYDAVGAAEQEMASASPERRIESEPTTSFDTENVEATAGPVPGSSAAATTVVVPTTDVEEPTAVTTAAPTPVTSAEETTAVATTTPTAAPVTNNQATAAVATACPLPASSSTVASLPAPATDSETLTTAALMPTMSSTADPVSAPLIDVDAANDIMAAAIVPGPSATATTMQMTSAPRDGYYTPAVANEAVYLGASVLPAQQSAFVQPIPREHTRGPSNRVASTPAFMQASTHSQYTPQSYATHLVNASNVPDWHRGGPTNEIVGGMSGSPSQMRYQPVATVAAFPAAGPSSVQMGFTSSGPQYQSFENQALLPHLQQGTYAQGFVPVTYPAQATNMGYYNPSTGPSDIQPFPPFQQDFVDPYDGGQVYHTPYNAYGGPRPKGNSGSRGGRGRGRRASQQNEGPFAGPAIYNPQTNRLEAVDSFRKPLPVHMGPQSRPRDGFNQNRSSQNRDRNASFSQFRGNGSDGRSNYNGRRSSSSRPQGPHHTTHYGQQAVGSQTPMDLAGPSTSSRPSTSAGPSTSTAPTYSGKGKATAVVQEEDVNEPSTSSAAPTYIGKGKAKAVVQEEDMNVQEEDTNVQEEDTNVQPSISTLLTYSGKGKDKVIEAGPSGAQSSAPVAPIHGGKGKAKVESQEDGSGQDSQNPSATETEPQKTAGLTRTRASMRREEGKSMTDSTSSDDSAGEGSWNGTNTDDLEKKKMRKAELAAAAAQRAAMSELPPDVDGTIRRSSESQLYNIQPESTVQPSATIEPSVQTTPLTAEESPQVTNAVEQANGESQAPPTAEATSVAPLHTDPHPLNQNDVETLHTANTEMSVKEPDRSEKKATATDEKQTMESKSQENGDSALADVKAGEQKAETDESKESVKETVVEQKEPGQRKHKYSLADWQAAPLQIQQREAQELAQAQASRKAVGLKPQQMTLPPIMEVFKKTAIEGSYGPRGVLSTTGEIDEFWDARERQSDEGTETTHGSNPIKTPPSESENGKTEEKDAGSKADVEKQSTEVPTTAPAQAAPTTTTSPTAEPQQNDDSLVEEEVFVTPQQEPSSATPEVDASKVDAASPCPTAGKAKAMQIATQSKPTNGSADTWVHPMALSTRQAKQAQAQAKKERKKEKKRKQGSKKAALTTENASANTKASGKKRKESTKVHQVTGHAEPIVETSKVAETEPNVEKQPEAQTPPVTETETTKATDVSEQSLTSKAEQQSKPAAPEAGVTSTEAEPATKKKSKTKRKKKGSKSGGDGEGSGNDKAEETEVVDEPSKEAEAAGSSTTTTKPKENVKPALPLKASAGKNIVDRIKAASAGLSENKAASNRPS